MKRLYVVGDGLTEVRFVTEILKPHLEKQSDWLFAVSAPRLPGQFTYAKLKRDLKRLLGPAGSAVVVTSMIDLFKIAGDFPGRGDPQDNAQPAERVQYLEKCFADDVADPRFLPHLQLHEFEALLLWDVELLARQHPNRSKAIEKLGKRLRREFPTPEHVNRLRPPSYWILEAVPEYKKVVDGIVTAERIGLDRLRRNCPHFGRWLDRLESAV
jgi:hypothetical protein